MLWLCTHNAVCQLARPAGSFATKSSAHGMAANSPSAPAWLVEAIEGREGSELRALTVKGELTDALVDGVKGCENRTWRIPRGALLIHKGLAATPKEWVTLVKRSARGSSLQASNIVGAVYIDRTTTLAKARGKPFAEWAAGPLVRGQALLQVRPAGASQGRALALESAPIGAGGDSRAAGHGASEGCGRRGAARPACARALKCAVRPC